MAQPRRDAGLEAEKGPKRGGRVGAAAVALFRRVVPENFGVPNRIIDTDEAVELITAVLPDVDARELRERLGSKKGFVWIKRQITPKEQAEIFHLGLPGV